MAKKISTIPFGAELPPWLVDAFGEMVDAEGWTRKRALAAAVRAVISADPDTRGQWYRDAYSPVQAATGLAEEAEAALGGKRRGRKRAV